MGVRSRATEQIPSTAVTSARSSLHSASAPGDAFAMEMSVNRTQSENIFPVQILVSTKSSFYIQDHNLNFIFVIKMNHNITTLCVGKNRSPREKTRRFAGEPTTAVDNNACSLELGGQAELENPTSRHRSMKIDSEGGLLALKKTGAGSHAAFGLDLDGGGGGCECLWPCRCLAWDSDEADPPTTGATPVRGIRRAWRSWRARRGRGGARAFLQVEGPSSRDSARGSPMKVLDGGPGALRAAPRPAPALAPWGRGDAWEGGGGRPDHRRGPLERKTKWFWRDGMRA